MPGIMALYKCAYLITYLLTELNNFASLCVKGDGEDLRLKTYYYYYCYYYHYYFWVLFNKPTFLELF